MHFLCLLSAFLASLLLNGLGIEVVREDVFIVPLGSETGYRIIPECSGVNSITALAVCGLFHGVLKFNAQKRNPASQKTPAMKNLPLCSFLLACGLQSFAQDVDALRDAIKQRDIPQIQALIAAGVDVNGKERSIHTTFTLNLDEFVKTSKISFMGCFRTRAALQKERQGAETRGCERSTDIPVRPNP